MLEMWAVATIILILGLVDDLRSRKVHNGLVLGLFAFALASTLYFRGFHDSIPGLTGLMLALVLTIPLFAAGVVGGGDVKLFAAFALTVDGSSVIQTLLFSVVWGAIFGLTRAALQKQLPALVRNTYRISQRQRLQVQELHRLPYTFALLLGWFTQLTFLRAGVSPW